MLILICGFLIVWAFEIRHKEFTASLRKSTDDIEKLKDGIATMNKQLKALEDKLKDIGISAS
jgi:septal ring factor EnvC (AmiA/AmiB activator)